MGSNPARSRTSLRVTRCWHYHNVGAKVSAVRPNHGPAFSPQLAKFVFVVADQIKNTAIEKRLQVSSHDFARIQAEFYVEAFPRFGIRDPDQRYTTVLLLLGLTAEWEKVWNPAVQSPSPPEVPGDVLQPIPEQAPALFWAVRPEAQRLAGHRDLEETTGYLHLSGLRLSKTATPVYGLPLKDETDSDEPGDNH